jgi:hypothetical protein
METSAHATPRSSPWVRTAISGTAAALLSLVPLMTRSRRETGMPWTGINAVSHWLYGDAALRRHNLSGRYTAPGLVIHTLSAMLWAGLHRLALRAVKRRSTATIAATAAAVTAVAALTDLRLVPERLTPGFERRLSSGSVTLVYVAFAIGLAAAAARWSGTASRPSARADRA